MTKQALKRYLHSSIITFIASFAMTFCGMIMVEDFVFTKMTLISASIGALGVAVRTVAKIIYEVASDLLSSK